MIVNAPEESTINRLDRDGIKAVVGEDNVAYLDQKLRGGESGHKGSRYEQFFGVHRIARLARNLIEREEDARVEWQSDGFVDDFVVRRDHKRSFKGYQLKNSDAVSWIAGDHPIVSDFAMQHEICREENYSDIRLRLVCSDEARAGKLKAEVPDHISGYSSAFFFPYNESHPQLMYTFPWVREDFAYLSRNPRAAVIDASEVAQVLLGAWDCMAPKALVSEVVAQARSLSPSVLRALKSDEQATEQLSAEIKMLLDSIPDFEYRIDRGFLAWSAMDSSTSGILSFDCFDDKFHAWQTKVLKLAPSTFEELEVILT